MAARSQPASSSYSTRAPSTGRPAGSSTRTATSPPRRSMRPRFSSLLILPFPRIDMAVDLGALDRRSGRRVDHLARDPESGIEADLPEVDAPAAVDLDLDCISLPVLAVAGGHAARPRRDLGHREGAPLVGVRLGRALALVVRPDPGASEGAAVGGGHDPSRDDPGPLEDQVDLLFLPGRPGSSRADEARGPRLDLDLLHLGEVIDQEASVRARRTAPPAFDDDRCSGDRIPLGVPNGSRHPLAGGEEDAHRLVVGDLYGRRFTGAAGGAGDDVVGAGGDPLEHELGATEISSIGGGVSRNGFPVPRTARRSFARRPSPRPPPRRRAPRPSRGG
jgi:hypothetical protein